MILQKLASAIRQQDWFQVLIEIMIVIIGIYLGFQVQNWDQERKDRASGELYLSQIKEDIEFDLVVSKGMLSQAIPIKQIMLNRTEEMVKSRKPLEKIIVNAPVIVNAPDNMPEEMEFDNFKTLEYSTVFGWSYPLIRTTTYDDLQNSGKLALISNDQLRFLISDYYDQSRNARERILARITGYSDAVYTLVDGGNRTSFTHNTIDQEKFDQPDFDPNTSISEFIERAQTEDFIKLLYAEKNYAAFIFNLTQEQINRTEKLLKVLESEIP